MKYAALLIFVFINLLSISVVFADQTVKDGGVAITHTGPGDINITGYTIQQHRKILKEEKATLKKRIEELHKSNVSNLKLTNKTLSLEKQLLDKQIAEVESRLINIDESHKKRIASLESTIRELRSFKGDVDDKLLADAEAALRLGRTDNADQLFAQIEAQSQTSI